MDNPEIGEESELYPVIPAGTDVETSLNMKEIINPAAGDEGLLVNRRSNWLNVVSSQICLKELREVLNMDPLEEETRIHRRRMRRKQEPVVETNSIQRSEFIEVYEISGIIIGTVKISSDDNFGFSCTVRLGSCSSRLIYDLNLICGSLSYNIGLLVLFNDISYFNFHNRLIILKLRRPAELVHLTYHDVEPVSPYPQTAVQFEAIREQCITSLQHSILLKSDFSHSWIRLLLAEDRKYFEKIILKNGFSYSIQEIKAILAEQPTEERTPFIPSFEVYDAATFPNDCIPPELEVPSQNVAEMPPQNVEVEMSFQNVAEVPSRNVAEMPFQNVEVEMSFQNVAEIPSRNVVEMPPQNVEVEMPFQNVAEVPSRNVVEMPPQNVEVETPFQNVAEVPSRNVVEMPSQNVKVEIPFQNVAEISSQNVAEMPSQNICVIADFETNSSLNIFLSPKAGNSASQNTFMPPYTGIGSHNSDQIFSIQQNCLQQNDAENITISFTSPGQDFYIEEHSKTNEAGPTGSILENCGKTSLMDEQISLESENFVETAGQNLFSPDYSFNENASLNTLQRAMIEESTQAPQRLRFALDTDSSASNDSNWLSDEFDCFFPSKYEYDPGMMEFVSQNFESSNDTDSCNSISFVDDDQEFYNVYIPEREFEQNSATNFANGFYQSDVNSSSNFSSQYLNGNITENVEESYIHGQAIHPDFMELEDLSEDLTMEQYTVVVRDGKESNKSTD